jgi:hypothetical protein
MEAAIAIPLDAEALAWLREAARHSTEVKRTLREEVLSQARDAATSDA